MINTLYEPFLKWSRTGSVYIISDTHFDDEDCPYMDQYWPQSMAHIKLLKSHYGMGKLDTLIHLGDVGNPEYLNYFKCYKVLIKGNHDAVGRLSRYFDEIYTGPLFISDKILLSHEPIYGLEKFCVNIHGHDHDQRYSTEVEGHINMASNVARYEAMNLGKCIEAGMISQIPDIHRITIDSATARKNYREGRKAVFI